MLRKFKLCITICDKDIGHIDDKDWPRLTAIWSASWAQIELDVDNKIMFEIIHFYQTHSKLE
jgi:hypothetical protein